MAEVNPNEPVYWEGKENAFSLHLKLIGVDISVSSDLGNIAAVEVNKHHTYTISHSSLFVHSVVASE